MKTEDLLKHLEKEDLEKLKEKIMARNSKIKEEDINRMLKDLPVEIDDDELGLVSGGGLIDWICRLFYPEEYEYKPGDVESVKPLINNTSDEGVLYRKRVGKD